MRGSRLPAADPRPSARPTVPRPRAAAAEPVEPVEPVEPPTTRPRAASRRVRAWILPATVDLAALLAPLLVTDRYWRGTLFTAGLTVVIFAAGGLYRPRRHLSILDELPRLCGRLLASGSIVAIIAATRHDSVGYVAGFARTLALSAGLVLVGRAATRSALVVARRRRWVHLDTVVIGSGPVAVELARLLASRPEYGLRLAGTVGTLDDLPGVIAATGCEVLVVADPDCPEPALMEMLRRPACLDRELWVVPRLWGSRAQGGLPDHIGAIPVVQIRYATLSGPRWAVKRVSDLLFAATALVVLSPVFLLCAIATRVESGPGVFFRQERIGRHGRSFRVVKFRTMRPADEDESRTRWSIAGDERVGPVGRFLRRTSLDELPQLWNILRGDMTVVGPRPERPHFVERFSAQHPDYAMRHRVPVGLTGLAQVSGLRGDTPIADRARFDNYYIENWSLWLDAKVILRTIAEVLRGRGR